MTGADCGRRGGGTKRRRIGSFDPLQLNLPRGEDGASPLHLLVAFFLGLGLRLIAFGVGASLRGFLGSGETVRAINGVDGDRASDYRVRNLGCYKYARSFRISS